MSDRPATRLIHAPDRREPDPLPLTPPIYETTTFVFESAADVRAYAEGRDGRYFYSRYDNPTVRSVETAIAALEQAEAALIFGSGMAAVATTILGLTGQGDGIVCSSAIYGGTLHLLTDLLPRFGLQVRFASLDELRQPDGLLDGKTRMLWFETPVNPTLRCVDIARVAKACRGRGVVSVLDNTFATPLNQMPIPLGIDLSMHSATKYLNGHSDVTAGAIAGAESLVARVKRARRLLGGILDPAAAYGLGRGLRTLDVRVSRQNASAQQVAEFLDRDPRVRRVYYPGLASHPDHAIAAAQMRGFGGMLCLDLEDGLEQASRFFDRLRLFRRAVSLGGVESLCSLPVLTSHWGHTPDRLAGTGVTEGMARLSIGLEDPADLIADLDQALG